MQFDHPYILAVATWEPRKNLELLIKTFLDMKMQGLLGEHKLVLVGGRGWKDQRLADIISGTDSVIPLGYLPENQLAPLYTGADVFVFPSVYEGFGMPILEARACGTRIVTSDVPELHEAGGNDAIYVQPSLDKIRQGILDALLREKQVHSGDPKLPSWEVGASILATALMYGKTGNNPMTRK